MDNETLTNQKELNFDSDGESGTGTAEFEACNCTPAKPDELHLRSHLMEKIIARDNLNHAYFRVISNKGAAGIDGMKVDELLNWCKDNGEQLKESLVQGTYKPSLIRGVKIPKPGGGTRQLGIPTVVDRMVQQAILQVISPILEKEFSESSYGFRPGRSAHDAIHKAVEYVRDGNVFVVDIDLEKFFDRVNHDMLMARAARYIKDKRLLKLLRAFLNAGLMSDGVVHRRTEGTPQGGPLSPILANLLLTDLDRELEKRGHCFVRYADDCNIYVQSLRSGQRVFESITKFLNKKLKLKVNEGKSAVDHVSERSLLGYRLFRRRESWNQPEECLPF